MPLSVTFAAKASPQLLQKNIYTFFFTTLSLYVLYSTVLYYFFVMRDHHQFKVIYPNTILPTSDCWQTDALVI